MALSEERRQEILQALEQAYNLSTRLETQLASASDTARRDQLRQELDKCYAQIKQLESEYSGEKTTDERAIVRTYLDGLWQEFAKFDHAYFPKLANSTSNIQLEKWEQFLKTEKAWAGIATVPKAFEENHPTETNLEQTLLERKQLMLIGPAGSGKSTALRRQARHFGAAFNHLPDAKVQPLIPIFANLNQWKDLDKKLTPFLQEQITERGSKELADRLPDLMKEGRVVLLLDGLDELPRLDRNEKTNRIEDLRARSVAQMRERTETQNVTFIVTCHDKEYISGTSWHDLYMQNFTREQVEAFIQICYGSEMYVQTLTQGLLASLYESHHGKVPADWLTRPFYFIRLLSYYSKEKTLPEHPVKLLEFSVKEGIESEINSGRLPRGETEKFYSNLGKIAFVMTESGYWDGMDKEPLADQLFFFGKKAKADQLWKTAIGAGLMIDKDSQILFSQRLFQEYFAARHCVAQSFNSQLLFKTTNETTFSNVWRFWATLDKGGLVDNLLNSLQKNSSWHVRLAAIRAIGFLEERRAVEPLIQTLKDEVISMRAGAALGLGILKDRRAVEPLIQALKDELREVRLCSIIALGELNDARAIDPLISMVKTTQDEWQHKVEPLLVSEALGKLGFMTVLPLIEVIKNGNPALRPWAVDTLIKLGEVAVPLLTKALSDEDAALRQRVVYALGKIRDSRALEPLTATLRDSDSKVRLGVVMALGDFGTAAATPLIHALSDEALNVRHAAVEALGKTGDVRAVEPLLNALRERDNRLRWNATTALGKLGDVRALSALEWVAQNDTETVYEGGNVRKIREAATEAIQSIRQRQQK